MEETGNKYSHTDKISIVTGANSSMGMATVEALSDQGADRETGFGKTITGLLKPFFLTPAEGASTVIFLATDESVRNISRGYFYKYRIAKFLKRSKSRRTVRKLYQLSERMVER